MSPGDRLKKVLGKKIMFTGGRTGEYNELAICPFHKGGGEINPSFAIYTGPTTDNCEFGTGHCFTCGKSWPLRVLIEKLGVPVVDFRDLLPLAVSARRKRDRQLVFDNVRLPHGLLGVYDYCPLQLIEAGFQESTLKSFDIGFDFTTLRITFPVFDHYGYLVGISGRTLRSNDPRYKIYTSEFQVPSYTFKKERVVWGLNRFYTRAVTSGLSEPIVLCEGFKAAMWLWQNGVSNACCVLGTRISEEQLELMSRCSTRVVMFLDDDKPGREATTRGVHLLMRKGLQLEIARYPESKRGKSPDDLTKNEIDSALEDSMGVFEWVRTEERPCLGN